MEVDASKVKPGTPGNKRTGDSASKAAKTTINVSSPMQRRKARQAQVSNEITSLVKSLGLLFSLLW